MSSTIWNTGIVGPPGPPGPQGPTGPAPTLVMGTVTETLSPQITLIPQGNGTYILNFGLQRGPQGPTGPAGDIANLTIGTVSTGPAEASITGAAPNKVLNLTIPPGEPGPPGPRGTDSNLTRARAVMSGNQTPDFPTQLEFTGAVNNSIGPNVWSADEPTRLVVPTGAAHASIRAQVALQLPEIGDGAVITVLRNGLTFAATYEAEGWRDGSRTRTTIQLMSPDIPVVPGDFFELRCELIDATSAAVISAGTWFELTVSN